MYIFIDIYRYTRSKRWIPNIYYKITNGYTNRLCVLCESSKLTAWQFHNSELGFRKYSRKKYNKNEEKLDKRKYFLKLFNEAESVFFFQMLIKT